MTIIALTCFLVVGAAATSILGRASVPAAGPAMAMASSVDQVPVSNRGAKHDRLAVVTAALAAYEPPPTDAPLRQAFAASTPADIAAPKAADSKITPDLKTSDLKASDLKNSDLSTTPSAPPKPKLVVKPAPQKTYALLSDVQIAGIKERLKLSSSQEYYWPAVEDALRAVARKIHATRQANPNAAGAPISPDAEEVQQLKSAAMPLLFQLREDQKSEVRMLARLIGLEKVAAQI
jgi:hypothetical protein